MDTFKVVVIEDERIIAKDIQLKLKSFGYAVPAIASSAEEAMDLVALEHPDLVLMDVVLRGKDDGIETAHQIQRKFDIPIVYLTAYADSQTLKRAQETGPFGYLLKPFKERDLQITVEMALYKHRMERKLREREGWLTTTLESIGDAVIATDVAGRIQLMNSEAEILTGWRKEDAIGRELKDVYKIFSETTRAQAVDPVATALFEGRDVEPNNHTVIIRSDGTEKPILQSGTPIKDPKGNIFGVVLVFRDMTDRHKAIEALRRSEERYREMFANNPQPMWVYDENTLAFLAVNSAAVMTYGYSEQEFMSMTIKDIRAAEEVARLMENLKAETELHHRGIWKHRKKDGSEIDVEVSSHPIQIEGHKARLVLVTDVTARQRAERAIRESEERYRNLVDNARDAIFALSRDAVITSLNPAFELLTGLDRQDWIGRSFTTLLHPEDLPTAVEQFQRTILGGEPQVYELRLMTRAGLYMVGEFMTTSQKHNGRVTGLLGIARDITERKKLEEHLRQSQKLESLGTLAGGIAHDFNNILGIVMGYASLIESAKSDPAGIDKSVAAIQKAVERGSGVVKQLLTFARKTNFQAEIIDVNNEISEMVKLLKETFPKTILFEMDLAGDLPRIAADRHQLYQALLNLSVNARDAMNLGGTLSFHTTLAGTAEIDEFFPEGKTEEYICISVRDTGSGMDVRTQAHVFEPFFSTKPSGKGTGLGLSVVYGIVKNHHGFVRFNTAVDHGTTFYLYLPVRPNQGKTRQLEGDVEMEIHGGKETILLVEDEEALLEVLKSFVEEMGYEVISATNGLEGVDQFRIHRDKIALVVSDVGLPVLSGWDACQRMRELNPSLPVIFASGYLDPSLSSETLIPGITEVIQKPYRPNDILLRIRRLLDKKNSRSPVEKSQ